MSVCKITSVQARRYLMLTVLCVLIWLAILFTQFFVPYSFHIMVMMGLVFSTRIGEFVKKSVWQ